jgi:hypothetical protein
MDEPMVRMVAEAYDEALAEGFAQGRSVEIAHMEGLTAAAMFFASMAGVDDATARAEVEAIGLSPTS